MSDSTDQISPNDIAIVGMALRVPGARNTREFWENLRGGVESIRDVTEEDLLASGEAASKLYAPNYVRRTAELPDMEMFDAEFFGLGPREAAIMDPQHRQFLECAWEAMEDAGRTPDSSAGPVGVFAGCGMGSYFYFNVCSNRQLVDQVGMFLLRHTGNDKDFLATRASFAFDLRGPSINVQTACSTSLVAVHLACQSLLSGECEMALAGGVTIELPHRRGYLHQEGEILAPDGHCRAFDHRAGGTVFGSGVGVVALRRLSDALADGDIVHAVIKGSAVNNDGASKATYLAPSVNGQAEAIIEAQGLAGVSADSIQYVECHGTGTYLGDPIEIEALTQAFRQSSGRTGFCRVGSVKSNIGHLDTAAGVVSLIKASLALKHGEIPATLGFEKPNPAIDFARSPFIVADRLTPWPAVDGLRRAAVNSLGVGGTNAHVVLEQAPARAAGRATREDEPRLFVFSAKQRKPLDQAMLRLGEALERDPDLSLVDTGFTLHAGRKPFEHRRVVAARGRDEAVALLRDPETRRAFTHAAIEGAKGAVFLFPGGGAQHPGMAGVLYREDALFRADIDEALSALTPDAAVEMKRVWMDAGLDGTEAASAFLRPSVQLPAILAVEVAVARHWMRQGVSPVALIGHSMGENAAACIAGVLSLRDAMQLVRLRGELFDTVEAGGMLSVPVSAAALAGLLPPELDLASVNAPELCVVSGRDRDLAAFGERLRQQGIEASRIPIDIAAHSRMLEPILARFEAFLRGIRLNAPTIPIVSNLTGDWLSDTQARDPLYWVRHLRSTVEFGKGVALLAAEPGHVFIEVGPGRALSSLVKLQPGLGANRVINSLPHADEAADDRVHLLAALGRAWATGLDVPLARLWDGQGARRVPLPTYPFQRQRHFIEQNLSAQAAEAPEDVIRKLPDLADWGYRPSWRPSVADFTLGADAVPGSFLVFLDEAGLGAGLVADLRVGGHRVATVRVGDTFARHEAGAFSLCPEDGRAGYDALLAGLASEGPLPTHILHLWLVTSDERHRPGSSFLNRMQEQGFHSLFHLAQALGDAGTPEGLQITVVTNGMQRLGDETLPYPEKATVLGPCLTIPKEMQGVGVRVIDLRLPEQEPRARGLFPAGRSTGPAFGLDALRSQLREDLFARSGSEIVAYRAGRRWSASYEKLPLPAPAEGGDGFRRGGVYLITGGSGDLALVMARQLHERYDAKLLLVGRSALPPRAAWPLYLRCHPRHDRLRRVIEQITVIEAGGGRVAYRSADVGNPEEMARVVTEAVADFGPIDGVLHTAGLVDDELMQMKTLERAEAVLAPKLHGTIVLDRLFRDVKLDLFVLFSSTSTDTAPAGQADYVAANAYLNAYAESRAGNPDRRTVAIHWGIWNEVGLAARATAATRPDEPPPPSSAKGPFFTRWIEDASGYSWLEAELSPRTDWLLDEHRMLSGQAVLPGTAYIEIAAQTVKEYGLEGTVAIDDLLFLRPLPVADGERLALRVRLAPEASGYRLHVEVAPFGSEDEAFIASAEASVLVRPPEHAATVIDLAGAMASCADVERADGAQALPSVQDRHLRFGPRWRVLRASAFTQSEAFAVLELPEAYRADLGDVLFHPALLDIATGFAMRLVSSYAASGVLWVPMSYGGITLLAGGLPASIASRVRRRDDSGLGEGYACFDVTITDADGRVLVEIERFVMKRLESDLGLLAERPDRPSRASHRGQGFSSPAALQLAAQVSQGILPQEGFEAMRRALASGQPQPIVSSMDLDALRRRSAQSPQAANAPGEHFERPDLDNDYVAPRNEIERTLAGFWSELLGVERIGVEDSFFDIGGHSLIAVRLFRMIKQRFALDLPISVLFEAPTISACAALIAQRCPSAAGEVGGDIVAPREEKASFVHLVTMSAGENAAATPFFLCAGMFGNVLNLRQLAMHLGADRPVYGLQARGLYGDQEPHETFEEAARDYLAEIRTVQPHGPYLLGGFSGGGLAAYEMARQLREAGEEVSLLVMLDTPLPFQVKLGIQDKLLMKLQDLRRDGFSFFTNWLRDRARWREEQRLKEQTLGGETSGAQFHNARIEAAFRRALTRYELRPHPGKVLLLRPKLNIVYRISGGRFLQDGRNPAIEDNGWTPYVAELEVQEVAGDHDGMVLEPFVRVLASRLRAALARASRTEEPLRRAAE